MEKEAGKLLELKEAVARFVFDGAHISIGGFTLNRNPMAAVYEIIRQGRRDLHLYAHSNGQAVDELVGAGCVRRLEIAYGGTGRFAPTCIRFRKAVQAGMIQVEDYSNYQMTLRFMAGAMGVPFLPCRSGLGSDLIHHWGFSEDLRKTESRLPDEKMVVMDNPFGSWGETAKVVLVPAITTDVTIIHVQKADALGNARIAGLSFADVEQAKSAEHLIVTCEELVSTDEMKADPDRNCIPFFCVDAVVHVPHGAYPTACYGYYDYDPAYLKQFADYTRDDPAYETYLQDYILRIDDHASFLEKIGSETLGDIEADPETGYANNLDRR
ncbi:glutaconate CoA-transferase subunit A [Desulfosarcina ovata subsp. sediminis]|uniref:Glutaconate CoA-transferase subunit A n=1 Tax=Desulfosarcina ovata subsp. sediminis TaxID=885957 RepID=A0A5K7ZNJ1_9BACT|nr:CoA-transferase [Desulfosarcina ovata]BBO81219.1 glutaconate CoA-transferase subunit A [Desulfosarcina ovata subsp. sediminis]